MTFFLFILCNMCQAQVRNLLLDISAYVFKKLLILY